MQHICKKLFNVSDFKSKFWNVKQFIKNVLRLKFVTNAIF